MPDGDVIRLQAFLRASAQHDRDVVRVAPFIACFHQRDELKYLNYAVPDDGADPDTANVDALCGEFRARDRLPRLEWIAEAAPLVAEALAANGMREELATPLMACAAAELAPAAIDADVRPVAAADALSVRNLQRAAFGQAPVSEADPDGRTVVALVAGEPAAAAAWTPVTDGVSEIVGVATAEPFRGRGLAGATTAAAARGAFAEGAELCVLSPGDEGAQRVYARAGFRRVATMLHWSAQPAA